MVGIEDERLMLMLRYFSICFHIPLSNRDVSTNGHPICSYTAINSVQHQYLCNNYVSYIYCIIHILVNVDLVPISTRYFYKKYCQMNDVFIRMIKLLNLQLKNNSSFTFYVINGQ